MTIKKENIAKFEEIFAETKIYIRNFEGCLLLELYQDRKDPSTFFTYSHWEEETYLEKYRNSPFFKGIWSKTRLLFSAPPKAWSLNKLESMS